MVDCNNNRIAILNSELILVRKIGKDKLKQCVMIVFIFTSLFAYYLHIFIYYVIICNCYYKK